MSGGVLIVGEVVDGGLHPTVRQLVNAAGQIGGDVLLCLAVDGSFEAAVLEGVGVERVMLLEHPDAGADGVGGFILCCRSWFARRLRGWVQAWCWLPRRMLVR